MTVNIHTMGKLQATASTTSDAKEVILATDRCSCEPPDIRVNIYVIHLRQTLRKLCSCFLEVFISILCSVI